MNQFNDARFPVRANAILYIMRLVVTLLLYIACLLRHGLSIPGIDDSGHGILGLVGLWISCAWMAVILSIIVLWILRIAPSRRPRWTYLALGSLFLVLFLSGVSRHTPNPNVGEILVGSVASLLFYIGLFNNSEEDYEKR